jgi:ribosomal protein S20
MSTVSAISAAGSSQTAGESKQEKITTDLKALAVALAKNDKAGAQTAMKQLQIDSSGGTTASSSSSNNASTEIAQVAAALKAGNLSAAQSAFSAFESNATAAFEKGRTKSGDASDTTNFGVQSLNSPAANKNKLNVVV